MVQRKSKKGDTFWGCSRFVKGCKSTMNEDAMISYIETLKKTNTNKFVDKD